MKVSSIRNYSSWVVLTYDTVAVVCAWMTAYFVRYNLSFTMPREVLLEGFRVLPIILLIHIIFYRGFQTYRPLWRFSSSPELIRLCKAIISAWITNFIILFWLRDLVYIPRATWVVYPLLLITILVFGRLCIRFINNRTIKSSSQAERILIIGAGKGAELFLRDLERWSQKKYQPVAMLDDKLSLRGKEIRGVPILGTTALIPQVIAKKHIALVVIAIPSIKSAELKRILEKCEAAQVAVRILPSLEEITNGQVSVSDLREVSLDDLLGRDSVKLDWQAINHFLHEEVVLVTGGGGSIGSELCRQILKLMPKQLIIADHSEFNLYKIQQELSVAGVSNVQIALLDVTDRVAVQRLFSKYQPSVVFHAAAYKHVPMLEFQLRQGIRNNVVGTKTVAEMAVAHRVKKFILVSTDKAVNPTNIMGATKRTAEIFCQAYNDANSSETQFITVRFGNVIGSAGSVIPLFKQQLAKGGPITVTHPEMTRYFMTIPEASQLVLQAGAMGTGGEIFVLDMGKPVKIVDLAKQLIHLSGKKEVDIVYTGLRPGEKLYEELFYEKEALLATEQQKIFKATSGIPLKQWQDIQAIFNQLEQGCVVYDETALATALFKLLDQEAALLVHEMFKNVNGKCLVN